MPELESELPPEPETEQLQTPEPDPQPDPEPDPEPEPEPEPEPDPQETLLDRLKTQPIMADGSGQTGLYATTAMIPQREDALPPPEMWYYRGANPNNFAEWGDIGGVPVLWRIVRFSEAGVVLAFQGLKKSNNAAPDEKGIAFTASWSASGNNSWNDGAVSAALVGWFQGALGLDETLADQIVQAPWPCGAAANNNPTMLATFLAGEGVSSGGLPGLSDLPFGTLLPSMFLMASTKPVGQAYTASVNTACDNDSAQSYLGVGGGITGFFWTNQPCGNSSSGQAWIYNADRGRINFTNVTGTQSVRPCIALRADNVFGDGDGPIENPFTIRS